METLFCRMSGNNTSNKRTAGPLFFKRLTLPSRTVFPVAIICFLMILHLSLAPLSIAEGTSENRLSEAEQENALWQAVASGNTELVQKLLDEGYDPNYKPDESEYPQYSVLMRAISKGNQEIIRLLLEYGADPNDGYAFDGVFESPLGLSVESGDRELVIKLLDHGADQHGNFFAELEPMIFLAARLNMPKMVSELVKRGASPNSILCLVYRSPLTVLQLSRKKGSHDVEKRLISYGAKEELTTEDLLHIINKPDFPRRQRLCAAYILARDPLNYRHVESLFNNDSFEDLWWALAKIASQIDKPHAAGLMIAAWKPEVTVNSNMGNVLYYNLKKLTHEDFGPSPEKWKSWYKETHEKKKL